MAAEAWAILHRHHLGPEVEGDCPCFVGDKIRSVDSQRASIQTIRLGALLPDSHPSSSVPPCPAGSRLARPTSSGTIYALGHTRTRSIPTIGRCHFPLPGATTRPGANAPPTKVRDIRRYDLVRILFDDAEERVQVEGDGPQGLRSDPTGHELQVAIDE